MGLKNQNRTRWINGFCKKCGCSLCIVREFRGAVSVDAIWLGRIRIFSDTDLVQRRTGVDLQTSKIHKCLPHTNKGRLKWKNKCNQLDLIKKRMDLDSGICVLEYLLQNETINCVHPYYVCFCQH